MRRVSLRIPSNGNADASSSFASEEGRPTSGWSCAPRSRFYLSSLLGSNATRRHPNTNKTPIAPRRRVGVVQQAAPYGSNTAHRTRQTVTQGRHAHAYRARHLLRRSHGRDGEDGEEGENPSSPATSTSVHVVLHYLYLMVTSLAGALDCHGGHGRYSRRLPRRSGAPHGTHATVVYGQPS